MANNIFQVKRTSTSGRTPNTTSSSNSQYINAGEFALNMTDKILYTSDGSNLITVGSNTVNQNVTNTISIGNSSVNSSINSTSFSGTSNNSLNLGGVAAASYVNTSGNYTLTGNVVLTANLTANTFYASNVVLGPVVSPFSTLNISTGAGGASVYAAYITSSNASAGNIRVLMDSNINPLLYFINNGYTGVVVGNSTVNQMLIGKVFQGAPVISAVDNLQIAYDSNNDGVGVFEIAKGATGGRIGTDGTSVFRLTNTGNVGLSNTAPVDRLSVNGTSYLQGNVTFTQGIIDSTGTQGTAGQVLTSNGAGNVYWSTPAAASVNVAAQYTWTNTQTFTNTITFNSTINGTGNSSSIAMLLTNSAEVVNVSATAANSTVSYYVSGQSVLYYTSNAAANWTPNVAFSSTTTLNTAMANGQSMTIAFLVTQGATAYFSNSIYIDGTTVTPKWQGGTTPTAGNASGIDTYTYTIIKTGTSTYTVLASLTQFK